MPNTVKARFLLGWMEQREAMDALRACVFDPPLNSKKKSALWKHFRDKVIALAPRNVTPIVEQALSATETLIVQQHLAQLNASPRAAFHPRLIKVHPGDLVLRQFQVVTERSELYGRQMQDDLTRINHCLGIGIGHNGQQFRSRLINPKILAIDLPHFEFTLLPVGMVNGQPQCQITEWDRYITAFSTDQGRCSSEAKPFRSGYSSSQLADGPNSAPVQGSNCQSSRNVDRRNATYTCKKTVRKIVWASGWFSLIPTIPRSPQGVNSTILILYSYNTHG
jgi:hypothetical protein